MRGVIRGKRLGGDPEVEISSESGLKYEIIRAVSQI